MNCCVYCVDGEVLLSLTEKALESLVSRIGPRMKFLKAMQTTKYGNRMSQRDNRTLGICTSASLSLSALDEESSNCARIGCIRKKRSVLRRQSRDTNRNIKSSVYCQYG